MTRESIERTRQCHASSEVPVLVTLAALVVSLIVALTAVSVGIARADTLVVPGNGASARLALALLVGLIIAGIGGATAALVENDVHPSRRG